MRIVGSFADRLPALRVVDASARPGAAHARNVGAACARGRALAFCDADDVVAPGWLEALVAALEHHQLAAGRLDFAALNDGDARRFEPPHGLHVHLDFLPAAASANLGIDRAAFDACGGFNELQPGGGAEDVDLCWRAQLQGFSLVAADDAVVSYRLRPTLAARARQLEHYGTCDALLYRDFRSRGVRRPSAVGVLRQWVWIGLRLLRLRRSDEWEVWARWIAYHRGRARGSIRYRVLFL